MPKSEFQTSRKTSWNSTTNGETSWGFAICFKQCDEFNNLYKNISGDARRMRTQYRYEDLQDNILWIRKRLDDDYFAEAGIPEEKISEFIAFHENPQIVTAIKAKNLTKAMFLMEAKMPIYLERLKVK